MDFVKINEALEPYSEFDSAAFLQGMLYGLRCGNPKMTVSGWVKQVLEEADAKSVKESFLKLLQELYVSSEEAMKGSGFELEMCLPEEEESLSVRALMLGQWCEGFIYGFGIQGQAQQKLSPEVKELFRDFADIAAIDVMDLADASDEDESDFMQLVEFVRIGVLTINEDLNPVKGTPIMNEQPPTDSVH